MHTFIRKAKALFWLLRGRCPTHHTALMRDHWDYEEKDRRDCFLCRPFVLDEPRYPYGIRAVLRKAAGQVWDWIFPLYTHCQVCKRPYETPQRHDCHSPGCNIGA